MILEKGGQPGREAARVEGTRRAVLLAAGLRFSTLGDLPELDAIAQLELLRELF